MAFMEKFFDGRHFSIDIMVYTIYNANVSAAYKRSIVLYLVRKLIGLES